MPRMTPSQVEEAVVHGELAALSIDAEVFARHGFALEAGLLARLRQFRESNVSLVLADVVVDDVKERMAAQIADADQVFTSAARGLKNARNIGTDDYDSLQSETVGSETPEACAARRFEDFMRETGCTVVNAGELVSSGVLLSDYLDRKPPFAAGRSQRNRLPDAIALHALDAFAESCESTLLVVSQDRDWIDYCDASDWLVCEPRLDEAMARFQSRAQFDAAVFAVQVQDGKTNELIGEIGQELAAFVKTMEIAIDAGAQVPFRCEVETIAFKDFAFPDPPAFTLVGRDKGEDRVDFTTGIEVTLDVTCRFDFQVNSGAASIPVGTVHETRSGVVPFEIAFSIFGDLEGSFEVDDIEVLTHGRRFGFGPVAPRV